VLRRCGDFKRAEEFFRKALSLKEDHLPALINLGHLLLFEGRNAEARPYLLKAFERDPNAVDVLLALCLIDIGEGRIEEALVYLELVLYNLSLKVEKELDSFKEIGEVFKLVEETLLKEGRNYEALLAKRSSELLWRLEELFPG
jgi:tetratricopeptide (TPR) repeat protein